MAHDVFISYSKDDKPSADRVCALIEEHGFSCWIAPRDIPGGSNWPAAIVKAIQTARAMVILVSKAGSASPQIPRELELADESRIPVIPLRLEPLELAGELKYFLSNRQWTDCYPQPIETHIPAVVQTIAGYLGASSDSAVKPQPTGISAAAAAPAFSPAPASEIAPPPSFAETVLIQGAGWAAALRVDPAAPFPLANPSLRPEILRIYTVGSQMRTALLLVNDGLQSMISQSLSPQQWEIDYRNFGARGQRLMRLTCSSSMSGGTFVGVWGPGLMAGGPWQFLRLVPQVAFQSWAQQYFASGLSVTDVSVCPAGGAPAFTGVWCALGIPSALNIGMSWPDLQSQHATMTAQGYRLVALSGYSQNSFAMYAAAWQQTGPSQQRLMTAPSAEEFKLQCGRLGQQGLRLVLMDAFDINGVDRYAGVWDA